MNSSTGKSEADWINLADHCLTTGEKEKSLDIIKRGIIFNPDSIDLLNYLFKIRSSIGMLDQFPTPRHALHISTRNGLALFYKRKFQYHLLERNGDRSRANNILELLKRIINEDFPFHFYQEQSIRDALKAWRIGDFRGSFSIMGDFFGNYMDISKSIDVRGNFSSLEHVKFLVHFGETRKASKFLERITHIDANLEENFFVFKMVCHFCNEYNLDFTNRDEGEMIDVVLPIWGEPYLTIWENGGLENFLGPDASEFFENRIVEFHIYTFASSLDRLRNMPGMKKLGALASIRYFNLDITRSSKTFRNFLAMNIAQWTSLSLARIHGAAIVFIFADTLYSRGSINSIDRDIRDGTHDVLFTIDLQMDMDAWDRLNDKARFPNGAAAVSAEDLTSIFAAHPSAREISWRVSRSGGRVPARPFRWSVEKNATIELRSVVPQPMYVSRGAVNKLIFYNSNYLDKIFVESAIVGLNGGDRMRILTDPGEFMCATVDCSGGRAADGELRAVPTTDVLGTTFKDLRDESLLNEARFWAIRQPLVIGSDRSKSILDDIAREFIKQPAGASNQFIEFLRFSQEISLPAFEAARKRHGAAEG